MTVVTKMICRTIGTNKQSNRIQPRFSGIHELSAPSQEIGELLLALCQGDAFVPARALQKDSDRFDNKVTIQLGKRPQTVGLKIPPQETGIHSHEPQEEAECHTLTFRPLEDFEEFEGSLHDTSVEQKRRFSDLQLNEFYDSQGEYLALPFLDQFPEAERIRIAISGLDEAQKAALKSRKPVGFLPYLTDGTIIRNKAELAKIMPEKIQGILTSRHAWYAQQNHDLTAFDLKACMPFPCTADSEMVGLNAKRDKNIYMKQGSLFPKRNPFKISEKPLFVL